MCQVLNLWANHVIRPEMVLRPLQSSQSAWAWSASDFSEGEASQETLAVRFKTPELVRLSAEHADTREDQGATILKRHSGLPCGRIDEYGGVLSHTVSYRAACCHKQVLRCFERHGYQPIDCLWAFRTTKTKIIVKAY